MLDDLSLFISIVRAGSLNMASEQQNIPAATLTRRLKKLEESLGCKLLHRNSRGIQLTQEGQRYYERCQPLLSALLQNTHEIKEETTKAKGRIKILAPMNLAIFPLQEFWNTFLKRYPEIELELQLDNVLDDLMTQGADLALRVGKMPNSVYIQKRLASIKTCIVASQDYLNQHDIQTPEDLAQQDWLLAYPLEQLELRYQQQNYQFKIQTSRLKVNEISLCVSLAEHGLGLCYVPFTQCEDALKAGRLKQVLPEWQLPIRDVYAVWHAQKVMPARVKVIIEELDIFFQKQTWNHT
jgi:LysR family transcriptional regulator AphB